MSETPSEHMASCRIADLPELILCHGQEGFMIIGFLSVTTCTTEKYGKQADNGKHSSLIIPAAHICQSQVQMQPSLVKIKIRKTNLFCN